MRELISLGMAGVTLGNRRKMCRQRIEENYFISTADCMEFTIVIEKELEEGKRLILGIVVF